MKPLMEYMWDIGLLALGLGIKHSFDADHVVAVSNILSRSNSIKNSIKFGMSWAVGHMLTATLITILLFSFRDGLLPIILERFEILAALMLIGLGVFTLIRARGIHFHMHKHGGKTHTHYHLHAKDNIKDHSHRHIFGIGVIHGLASNDELLLLLTASMGLANLGEMIAGVAVFSLGVVIGMVIFSLLFTYSILNISRGKMGKIIDGLVGGSSIAYGTILLFGL